ncbi:nucleotidyltransferase family protein [Microbacterium hominis]|uniref:Nucleotidyltransferase family protein n=1 Tax=Microbacterium hominis TaxID=162426 RepID=A0A7D4UI64_9MICO|nr:nucleotidyltransferase family protein [Microbacterium hominis]QKJ18107.1 nucleotidyltransferase family protein [Microbacterium hominis]
MRVSGLVLAAGAGTRYGGPKGLVRDAGGIAWVERAVWMLRAAACDPVLVAVGAQAGEVAALVPAAATAVSVEDWAEGLSATLRAGLRAASLDPAIDAVVVTPVDTPDAPAAAVQRVVEAAAGRTALVQAVYGGRPGHPVLIGRDHLDEVCASLTGDRGARPYLTAHGALEVECGDLWSGADIDRPSGRRA